MTRSSRWSIALLAAATLLGTATLIAGVTLPVGPGPPERSRGEAGTVLDLSPCLFLEPVRSVGDLNDFVRTTAGVPELRGADLGVDVLLGDGRRLWIFADTLQSDGDGTRFVRNSALLVDAPCVRAVSAAGRTAVLADRDDGVGYWPMSAIALARPGRTLVVVLAQRVQTVGEGPYDFRSVGTAVGVLAFDAGESPVLRRVEDLGPDDADPGGTAWGAAAVRRHRWVYLYGTSTRSLPGVHGFALHVARTRVPHIDEPAAWRFWDGRRWQADPAAASRLIQERGGVSQTLSVFRARGRWWALSKQDEFLGTFLSVWSAEHPRGPFGPATPLLRIPCEPDTGTLRYLALAHPDLLPRPGTVVVSWSRNDEDLADVCLDPRLYRPHFRRVRLPLGDR